MRVKKVQNNIPTWEEALEQFLFWKKAQGKSERTRSDYRKIVSLFFKRYPCSFEDLKNNVFLFMGQDVMPATYNLRLVNLKAFFKWCIEEEFLKENPLEGFKRKKTDDRIVDIKKEALVSLISSPDKKTFSGLRDYVLVLLTLDTGIRPGEAFQTLLSDINLGSLEVHIRAEVAKARKSRTLIISPVTAGAIKKLIGARHPDWKSNVPVICTADGTIFNVFRWGERLDKYAKKIGIKLNPYDLRHAFALEFLRNGGNILALQRILGHTDLTMTKRYVAFTEGDMRKQHELASPLNTLLPQKNRLRKIKKGELT